MLSDLGHHKQPKKSTKNRRAPKAPTVSKPIDKIDKDKAFALPGLAKVSGILNGLGRSNDLKSESRKFLENPGQSGISRNQSINQSVNANNQFVNSNNQFNNSNNQFNNSNNQFKNSNNNTSNNQSVKQPFNQSFPSNQSTNPSTPPIQSTDLSISSNQYMSAPSIASIGNLTKALTPNPSGLHKNAGLYSKDSSKNSSNVDLDAIVPYEEPIRLPEDDLGEEEVKEIKPRQLDTWNTYMCNQQKQIAQEIKQALNDGSNPALKRVTSVRKRQNEGTLIKVDNNGDILTKVTIPRSGSFLNTSGLTRYKSKVQR